MRDANNYCFLLWVFSSGIASCMISVFSWNFYVQPKFLYLNIFLSFSDAFRHMSASDKEKSGNDFRRRIYCTFVDMFIFSIPLIEMDFAFIILCYSRQRTGLSFDEELHYLVSSTTVLLNKSFVISILFLTHPIIHIQ